MHTILVIVIIFVVLSMLGGGGYLYNGRAAGAGAPSASYALWVLAVVIIVAYVVFGRSLI